MYNFDIENSVETFMLTIEEKLNRESSLKWEDKKAELRKETEMVTIEQFVEFFTEKNQEGRKCELSEELCQQGRY